MHNIGCHLFSSFSFHSADALRANLGSGLPFSAKSQGVYLFIREFRASWTSLGEISILHSFHLFILFDTIEEKDWLELRKRHLIDLAGANFVVISGILAKK